MTIEQIDARRQALGWTYAKLAREARIGISYTKQLLKRQVKSPNLDFYLQHMSAALARGELAAT